MNQSVVPNKCVCDELRVENMSVYTRLNLRFKFIIKKAQISG